MQASDTLTQSSFTGKRKDSPNICLVPISGSRLKRHRQAFGKDMMKTLLIILLGLMLSGCITPSTTTRRSSQPRKSVQPAQFVGHFSGWEADLTSFVLLELTEDGKGIIVQIDRGFGGWQSVTGTFSWKVEREEAQFQIAHPGPGSCGAFFCTIMATDRSKPDPAPAIRIRLLESGVDWGAKFILTRKDVEMMVRDRADKELKTLRAEHSPEPY